MSTIEIICDNTELTAIYGAEVPDVIVIGGYALPDSDLPALLDKVRHRKQAHFANPHVPIKWNVKDLQRALNVHGLDHMLPSIIQKSEAVRKDLLQSLVETNATLFISILLAYSNRKQVLGKTKDDLIRYSFGNLLMRTGIFCKRANFDGHTQVILDWPDSGKRNIFISEYLTGWKDGVSITEQEQIQYHCGPLSAIRFRSAPLFGITDLDERLQLADLVVGASRSFVDFCMGRRKESDFGVQQFVSISRSFDREDGWKCFGHGITVAPANSPFSKIIFDGFKKLGL
jgi:hypothetical protein